MSRAELYQKLLRQASRELHCKVTDERAKNYAVLKLAREVISSKLVSGRDIDPSALRWLAEELEKYTPSVPLETPQAVIKVCRVHYGVCRRCGFLNELPEKPELQPPPITRPVPPPAGLGGASLNGRRLKSSSRQEPT